MVDAPTDVLDLTTEEPSVPSGELDLTYEPDDGAPSVRPSTIDLVPYPSDESP